MPQGNTFVGHPVNVATGALYATYIDISITGKMKLEWQRRYSTDLLKFSPTPMGIGWSVPYFASLTVDLSKQEYRFFDPDGIEEIFSDPENVLETGGVIRHFGSFQELTKKNGKYIVTRWNIDTLEIKKFIFFVAEQNATIPLAFIEDATGQGLELLYDEKGFLRQIRQKFEKRTFELEYDSNGWIQAIYFLLPENQKQRLAHYEHDDYGRLTAAYNALEYIDRFEYDRYSRMTREIMRDGSVFTFKYDDKGRCIRTSGLDHYDEKTLRYLEHIGWTEVTNSYGHVTRYQWLPSGQIIKKIDPLGGVSQTEYDEFGRIKRTINEIGAIVESTYDSEGNLMILSDPMGYSTRRLFNKQHQVIEYTNKEGNSWKRSYDYKHRLIYSVGPKDNYLTFEYIDDQRIEKYINATGYGKTFKFSESGNAEEVIDYNGGVYRYAYDVYGNTIQETDPLGGITKFTYNSLMQLTDIVYPDGNKESYFYHQNNEVTQIINTNNEITKFTFGTCKRVREVIRPDGQTVSFLWGTEPGKLLKVVVPGGQDYSYEYDPNDNIVKEIDFDGRTIRYSFDLSGRLIKKINNLEQFITYEYDLNNNITKRTSSDGQMDIYEYNPLGLMTVAKNALSKIEYKRDVLGRIISERQDGFQIDSAFDPFGFRTEIQTNFNLHLVYSFGPAFRVSSLTVNDRHTFAFEYDLLDREVKCQLPHNQVQKKYYNSIGELIKQRVFSGYHDSTEHENPRNTRPANDTGSMILRKFTYDPVGELTEVKDNQWGRMKCNYDVCGRIVSTEWENEFREGFMYDERGNIIEFSETRLPENTKTIRKSKLGTGNQITGLGNTILNYDAHGRLVERIENPNDPSPVKWIYKWNAHDQLSAVICPDGSEWTYKYDALERRIFKNGPAFSERYVWDQEMIIHSQKSTNESQHWIFSPDTSHLLAKMENGQFFTTISDQIGMPRELIDMNGKIAWAQRFYTWGKSETVSVNETDCTVRFLGQWYDEESGFHYNRFRYYSPETGGFISRDPVGLEAGKLLYHYAPNPFMWFDFWGLDSVYVVLEHETYGDVIYSGITKRDILIRQGEHQKADKSRQNWVLKELPGTGPELDHNISKAIEQYVISYHKLKKDYPNSKLVNIINSMSEKKFKAYKAIAEEFFEKNKDAKKLCGIEP